VRAAPRLWSKACEATGIRQLTEIFSRLPSGYPTWVRKKLNRKVYEVLTRPRLAKHQEEDETCSESVPDASGPAVIQELRTFLPYLAFESAWVGKQEP